MPDDIAAELTHLAAAEPPFLHPAKPRFVDRYLAVLGGAGSATAHNFGLIFELPNGLPAPSGVPPLQLIGDNGGARHELMRSIARDGMPAHLSELGFRSAADFWPPWCAALIGGEVAAIAFAARLSAAGAELGVVTAKAWRGHGLAAAVTAGWSRLSALRRRTLFYSTDLRNVASQRVAARLGLRLRGTSLRIA